MALVAGDYGSGSSDSEDDTSTPQPSTSSFVVKHNVDEEAFQISDEEEDEMFIGMNDSNEETITSQLFQNLPSPTPTTGSHAISNEENSNAEGEREGIVPERTQKELELAKKVESQKPSALPKKSTSTSNNKVSFKHSDRRRVQILLPALPKHEDSHPLSATPPSQTSAQDKQKSGFGGLLSLLPPPKRSFTSSLKGVGSKSVDSDKQQTVCNSLVPDVIGRKIKRKLNEDSQINDSGGVESFSNFFSMPENENSIVNEQITTCDVLPGKKSVRMDARVISPMVGPAKPSDYERMTCNDQLLNDGSSVLVPKDEALERLAGRHAMRRSGNNGTTSSMALPTQENIVDVNMADLKGDPKEWIKKTLTDNGDDRPGPKCGIKGNAKRKHQITYLAAMAKQNENALKAQWAISAANRKSSSSKYGF